jgi:hypothetical protein
MRKLALLCLTGLVALGFAGSSSAAPLNWQGTATLILGDFPQGVFTGGGVATVNNAGAVPAHLNTLRLAASRGQVGGDLTQIVTDPDTIGNGIAAIQYVGIEGGTGTLGGISGGAAPGGTPLTPNLLPVRGLVKVCLVSTACSAFLPLVLTQPTANGIKGVGIGGILTIGGVGAIRLSIQAAPWTIKTATVIDQITTPVNNATTFINVVLTGFAHGPASLTTSTAQPSGVVQVVTPNQVRTNLPLGSNALLASAVTQVIRFVPEPGMLLLLGSGVAGLALLGRKRLRK